MIERQVDTTIPDALGVDHDYTTVKFGAEYGVPLGLRVAKIIAGPLAEFLTSVDLSETESVLDVDVGGLGRAIADLPTRIIAEGGYDLIASILRGTRRAHVDSVTGQKKWADLKDRHHIDAVYAGNYAEMVRAVGWVLLVNYAPFGMDGTQSWKGLLSALLPSLPAQAAESDPPMTTIQTPTAGTG